MTEAELLAVADLLESCEQEGYDTGWDGETASYAEYTYYRGPDGSFHMDAADFIRHLAANPGLIPAARGG